MSFSLPGPVLQAIRRLNSQGHAAYAVGGCVWDMLRGETPHDYDICVSCPPEETHACFAGERVIDTGIRHGTVTVLLGGMPLEITTFRMDGVYLDGRHPQSVSFTDRLEEDLKRRDFTVNAMAYHPETGLVDLFGGQADLAAGVIRCVGDAPTRLTEDALRILRALRFAARLGFAIEADTAAAMHALRERLTLVSRERIAEELLQTLQAAGAARVLSDFPDVLLAALPAYPAEDFPAGLDALTRLPAGDSMTALAALLHRCRERVLQQCLDSLHLSRELYSGTLALCRLANHAFPLEETALYLSQLGEGQLERLLTLQLACGTLTVPEVTRRQARARAALAAGLPLELRQLSIRGEDLKALGYEGAEIGETLNVLHALVLRGKMAYDRSSLLAWAARNRKNG